MKAARPAWAWGAWETKGRVEKAGMQGMGQRLRGAGLHLQCEIILLKLLDPPNVNLTPLPSRLTWYRGQPRVGIHRNPCCFLWGLVEGKPAEPQAHQPGPRPPWRRGTGPGEGLIWTWAFSVSVKYFPSVSPRLQLWSFPQGLQSYPHRQSTKSPV